MWKVIPDYSKYAVSAEGQIKVLNYRRSGKERIMRPALDNCGYLRTMILRDDGVWKTVKMHRLIALAFIENPLNKPQVNHINSIRNDNRVINLEWVTASENTMHSFTNKMQSNVGEKNPCASLTDTQVLEIRANYNYGRKSRHCIGLTKKEIAEKYKTTTPVIKRIIQNKTWKHLL